MHCSKPKKNYFGHKRGDNMLPWAEPYAACRAWHLNLIKRLSGPIKKQYAIRLTTLSFHLWTLWRSTTMDSNMLITATLNYLSVPHNEFVFQKCRNGFSFNIIIRECVCVGVIFLAMKKRRLWLAESLRPIKRGKHNLLRSQSKIDRYRFVSKPWLHLSIQMSIHHTLNDCKRLKKKKMQWT